MSKKGSARNSFKIKKGLKARAKFCSLAYPDIKKYQYAKMRFVDGMSIEEISRQDSIEINSCRRYTEIVYNEIYNSSSGNYRTISLRTRGVDQAFVIEMILDQYADAGFFQAEGNMQNLDWTSEKLFTFLTEKGVRIHLTLCGEIFTVKNYHASVPVCETIIKKYIDSQKKEIPMMDDLKIIKTDFLPCETLNRDQSFTDIGIEFGDYEVQLCLPEQKKLNSFSMKLPIYKEDYGNSRKYKNYQYKPMHYPLTAVDLFSADSQE